MSSAAQQLSAPSSLPPNAPAGMMGGAEEQLPHGIRGLLPYAMSWLDVVIFVLIVAALIAAVWFLWRWWSRRQPKKKIEIIDYYKLAMQRVKRMQPPQPFLGKTQEDYFYGLSLALRECIEIRTKISATDLTLKELKEPLRRGLPLPTEEIESVLSFLERADMVKFAGMESNVSEAAGFWDKAVGWSSKLKPREEEIKQFGQEDEVNR